MNKPRIFIYFIALTLLLSSCATYHLSTQSMLEQFADTQKEKKVNVIVAFPFFFPGVVSGNSLREVKVLDKNGREQVLRVTHHTGVRITKKDGKRKTFYFDTLLLKDSTITGSQSHFGSMPIKPILLRDVAKIELQR